MSRDAVVTRLRIDPRRYDVVGSGGWWKTIRVVAFDHHADAFRDREEPSLALTEAFRSCQGEFAAFLAGVPVEGVEALRRSGVELNVFLDAWIDEDRLDLVWDFRLLAELGRLGLDLEVVTND